MDVDPTYRWVIVLAMSFCLLTIALPLSYRKGFPRRPSVQQMVGGAIMIVIGLIYAAVLNESPLDALLLRARFGFVPPDIHIDGYGWFLIFGHSFFILGAVTWVVGRVMFRLRYLPPWIDSSDRDKSA